MSSYATCMFGIEFFEKDLQKIVLVPEESEIVRKYKIDGTLKSEKTVVIQSADILYEFVTEIKTFSSKKTWVDAFEAAAYYHSLDTEILYLAGKPASIIIGYEISSDRTLDELLVYNQNLYEFFENSNSKLIFR